MNLAIAKMSKTTPYQEWHLQLGAKRGKVERENGKKENVPKQGAVVK